MEGLNNLSGITKIREYQGHRADYSIVFDHPDAIRPFRVFWLRHKRADWAWVAESKAGTPYVLIKEHDQ